jgi:hypothetical protein
LSYDIQFGVDSDWDLTNNGAQFDNDPCGKGMEGRSGVYPTNQNECESTTQSCFWAAPDNKCGFAQVTPASFRSDVLNSYRYTKTKDDTGRVLLDMGESVMNVSTEGLESMFDKGAGSARNLSDNVQGLVLDQFSELETFTMDTFDVLMDAIQQMSTDLSITSAVGMLKTSQLVSTKIFEATNAAIRLVRYVIGTYVGFGVVSRLLPFAMAIVAGVQKGTKAFQKITSKSEAFTVPADSVSLQKFNALLMFISGLVVAVPMISITIFFYQSFADQYFVLVVLAMEIWAVGQAFKGFLSKRKNQMVTAVAGALGLSGFVCWAVLDDNAMFVSEYLVMQGKKFLVGQSFVKILTVVANAGFNFFFSKVITAQLVSRLSAEIFAHGVTGRMAYVPHGSMEEDDAMKAGKMAYVPRGGPRGDREQGGGEEEEADAPRQAAFSLQYSNLESLDVWNRNVLLRSQDEAEKAGVGPYRARNLLGVFGNLKCCGMCVSKNLLDV